MRSWWSSVLRSKKKNRSKFAYSFDITILFWFALLHEFGAGAPLIA